jgi:minor extracellular serine protease Vpr
VRAGVDTMTAEPADAIYETAVANIQVLPSANGLKLELVSGDKQVATPGQALPEPVVVRVTDVNELPYSNVFVGSDITGGGILLNMAVSDEAGLVRIYWTPGPGPTNELTLSVAGGPALTVIALGRPAFAADAVVNAASFASGMSPGSIATLFGTNLVDASVSINGTPATVFFTNNRQMNFLVPDGIAEGLADVVVTTSAGSTVTVRVPVVAISPGLFAAVNRGTYVEIYATGLGPVKDQLTVTQPQVQIGSAEAKVIYSGLAPGFAGLYQVNVLAPDGLAAGGAIVSLQIGGKQSNLVRVQ